MALKQHRLNPADDPSWQVGVALGEEGLRRRRRHLALVDTGAEWTKMPLELGKRMGVDLGLCHLTGSKRLPLMGEARQRSGNAAETAAPNCLEPVKSRACELEIKGLARAARILGRASVHRACASCESRRDPRCPRTCGERVIRTRGRAAAMAGRGGRLPGCRAVGGAWARLPGCWAVAGRARGVYPAAGGCPTVGGWCHGMRCAAHRARGRRLRRRELRDS